MCEDGLYVWEWFPCVCDDGLMCDGHVWEWFGCVMMVCMCGNGLDV